MTVEISDRRIARYQTERLAEGAAPKTINEEIQLFLRLLPAAQAGAVRAQLKQDKKLKLKVSQKVGKAYSDDEKLRLLEAARTAKRSKGIYVAMMLAQHAGMRDKEIRNLRWSQVDLTKRVITVGESKTDAGTGRTIPINEELHEVIGEYALWYAERFGAILESWYVFPAGRPRPNDPTSPQTSLKTAWRNLRKAAAVQGRFHDNRHTFVTDLAESGVGDEVIRDMAGHVSKQMLKHYSHIRMEAKRKAVEALTKKKIRVTDERRGTSSRSGVQDSVQGSEK